MLLYLSRSGAFEEQGVFPKFGRVRIRLNPNPFKNGEFKQELQLDKGYVTIEGKNKAAACKLKIWVDVFNPVVHIEAASSSKMNAEAFYENWRFQDHAWKGVEYRSSRAYERAPDKPIIRADSKLETKKMKDANRRFPTFWGPGHDWVPDHNWGGTGMIGLQEMLLQESDGKIYLFPAWPKQWDVDFKLHAPQNTLIEGILKNGVVTKLQVSPGSRQNDVIISSGFVLK
ncbi:hypothetical protein AHMF7616_01119 [Adhaeribacter pallidiroseus]|uniref:DUF5703 domain-containing protein n=1 Tax=Adhaeribacter pallidiroseus TaxID=2072847 RepID=A0A369QG60_9BACT|nr:hypothetical protein AHMF7616_01119 [Adhaeribacter pallidiroseus]